ncbi:hypothetical protein ACHAPT_013357 [Fusarium lateritium]
MLARFIHPDHDDGPFKLICDDLSLANVLVRSEDDLTILGLVDFEWSYVGPAQLSGSAPWWLLGIRMNNVDTFLDEDHHETLARFTRYLDIFKRVLSEEEERIPGNQGKELSGLVEWSDTSGAMWLHMLLSCGFNHHQSLPFVQLQQHIGTREWEKCMRRCQGAEVDKFVKMKLAQLDQADQDEDRAMELKERMDRQEISLDQFITALKTY